MRRRLFIGSSAAWVLQGQDWRHSPAFQHLYNLDFEQAIPLLEADCVKEPAEPDHFNNLAYAILYHALFEADALDGGLALSVAEFLNRPKAPMRKTERDRFDAALLKAEIAARARGERADALYALGVSQTHRANLALLVDKDWRAALKTGGEARKYHARALVLDKTFVDAMLVPSFHEYIVGSLPIYLKAFGSLVGFTGDKHKGIEGLRTVAKYGQRARLEAQVLLALVEHREERPTLAIGLMQNLEREFPSNHLYRREVVSLLVGMKRKEEASKEFAELTQARYRYLTPVRLAAYRREFEAKLKA